MFSKVISAVLARKVMAGRRGILAKDMKMGIYLSHDFYNQLRVSANELDMAHIQELMGNSTIAGCPVHVAYRVGHNQGSEEEHPDFLVADYTDYEALSSLEVGAVPINCCNQGRATSGVTHSITCKGAS